MSNLTEHEAEQDAITAACEARDNLSILIRNGREIDKPTVVVVLREGYSEVLDTALVILMRSVYDPTATNRMGGLGAYGMVANADDIEAAVARLRAEFGPAVPVQNNLRSDQTNRAVRA